MRIRTDHLLHAETCALLCVVFALFLPVWLAGVLAFLAGIGKEVWDRYHDGVPSWSDFAWDCIGVAIGVLIALV